MALAHSEKLNDERLRVLRETAASSTREQLEKAQMLALQIERLLVNAGGDVPDSDTFRIRLARAHTLSLLDEISALLRPERGPGVAACESVDGEENTASGIRPVSSWR